MTTSKKSSHKNPKKYLTQKPIVKKTTPMQIMTDKHKITGSEFCGYHEFKNGNKVPIYEVFNVHTLTQLIGYAKFLNRTYGDVYYRGECSLHDTLMPSIFRGRANTSASQDLNSLIQVILKDEKMVNQLKIDIEDNKSAHYTIEGMLQHYGIKTRFLDVVDNHWVAIWMGLNRNKKQKQIFQYNHYEEREIPICDFVDGKECSESELFQYILLIAVPGKSERINNGIFFSDELVEIDLRQALPSTFLRPHAQHGLVIMKRSKDGGNIQSYDVSSSVVGIIKIRIDRAKTWIGNGELLTQNNLFPPPSFDQGYDILLSRTDIFNNEKYLIARYV